MTIDILFSDGRLRGGAGSRRAAALARAGSAVGRLFGRSDVGHVAVGYRGFVLDPQLGGDKVYSRDIYVLKYPGLLYWAELPGTLPGSVLALARAYPGRRCTQTACRMLRLAGHRVPEMRFPGQLKEWITTHGFLIDPVE